MTGERCRYTRGASVDSTKRPRSADTLKARPSSACAATAPRQTRMRGLDERDLRLEPRSARGDLGRVRLRVNAALAARLPLEMFHHVGEVHQLPLDSRLLERPVEQTAGRADEWMACDVFLVARLLADHHDLGMPGALTENRLRGARVEVARPAARRRFPYSRKRESIRQDIGHG